MRTVWLIAGVFLAFEAQGVTRYVWRGNPNAPVAPYTNWYTASTSIQVAVNAAVAGDLVLVTNGVYDGKGASFGTYGECVVAITKAITVSSVNGPEGTILDGTAARRCLGMSNAVVEGFTMVNGLGGGSLIYGGGGAFIGNNGIVRNCRIVSNRVSSAPGYGGGVICYKSGLLSNCVVAFNTATNYGGGITTYLGGWVARCTVFSNRVFDINTGGGGGIAVQQGGGNRALFLGFTDQRLDNARLLKGQVRRMYGNEQPRLAFADATVGLTPVKERLGIGEEFGMVWMKEARRLRFLGRFDLELAFEVFRSRVDQKAAKVLIG